MSKRSLFSELKRRNVIRAATFYAASAWLLVEVATQVFPVFGIADWLVRWIVLAAVIGFPFAMGFAWLYEWTPHGIKRESEIEHSDSITHQTGYQLDRWIIAVLALAVVALLANKVLPNLSEQTVPDKSVAVLALVNESGDPDNQYFSDGLSEELIGALAQIDGLKVISRNSSFRFKDDGTNSQAIGQKLGVGSLLEGTVRRLGERVRIVVGLVNVEDGHQLWSETYDRDLKDIFALQSEIAHAVADALKVRLLGSAKAAQVASTTSVDAHNAYLQGHFYLQRYDFESFPKAVALFTDAIRLDPSYALAFAERSQAQTLMTTRNPPTIAILQAAARSDAQRSIALEPTLAQAHVALGFVYFYVDWNFAGAGIEFKRAAQIAPGLAHPKYLLSQVLLSAGDVPPARVLAQQAVALDPLAFAARSNLARALMAEGRIAEAEAQGRKAAELQPGAVGSRRWQVMGAVLRGDGQTALREAQAESSQASARGPTQGFKHFELALAWHVLGDKAKADAALEQLTTQDSDSMAYQIAEVHAWRGESDQAFEWLQRAIDTHDAGTWGILTDPLLQRIRADPRFDAIVQKLGFRKAPK